MAFDGAGTFLRMYSWVVDATNSVKIRADRHDDEDNNFAEGLSHCITKDGQTLITQNIPWNSRRIISLADPIDPQDAATKDYADTKLSLTGDGTLTGNITITGNLTTSGAIVAAGTVLSAGYGTRPGLDGPAGANFFNLDWSGGTINAWIDSTNMGALATQAFATAQDAAVQSALQVQINTKQPNLGFTPVQQGGGAAQGANKIYIGWGTGGLRAQVDATDLGPFVFGSSSLVSSVRLALAGDIGTTNAAAAGTVAEPFNGAVMTGWSWVLGGGATAVIYIMRFRYLQVFSNGSWVTVGYA